MKTFDLTTHILDQHRVSGMDFLEYWINNEPANDDNNVIIVNFGGR